MQKIFIATILVVCQLISYSALATVVIDPPIYQIKTSDFIEKFNTLNKQYRYNLKPIKKDENYQSEIIYLFRPNIYLDMNSVLDEDELVARLELTCDQFSNNKLTGMNKCQQSIQLISEAFDPDFVLSDFEHNKVCTSVDETNSCSYVFNHVKYTLETEQNTQSLRFIISPFGEREFYYLAKSALDLMYLEKWDLKQYDVKYNLVQYYINYNIKRIFTFLQTYLEYILILSINHLMLDNYLIFNFLDQRNEEYF